MISEEKEELRLNLENALRAKGYVPNELLVTAAAIGYQSAMEQVQKYIRGEK